jgi:hypothetical protein
MRILELEDIDKDIKLNEMREVKSQIIYYPVGSFNPDGLFSEEIFGQTTDERTYRCGYIKLPIHVFNPGVAKNIIMKSGGILKKMANAEVKCDVEGGMLIPKEDGKYTGLKDLYDIWDQLDLKKIFAKSRNIDGLNILLKSPKRLIWNDKVLVIPPNLRPIADQHGRQVKSEINTLYSRLLGYKSVTSYTTTAVNQVYLKIQNTVIAIYVYLNNFVSGKTGFFQKALLSKNTLGATRNVISAPSYRTGKVKIGIYKTGFPLMSICSMFKPFVKFHMKQFMSFDNIQAVHTNPEEVVRENIMNLYDDRAIEELIQIFMFNPGSRFKVLYLDPNNEKPLMFNAINLKTREVINRPFTLTDLVYLASYQSVIVPDRMAYVVRYPIGKQMGAFFTGCHIMSTNVTTEIQYQGIDYDTYPVVDVEASHARVSTMFVDVVNMSNSRLDNIGGDYDGDTIKSTGIWSDEANDKARQLMKSKSYNIYINGDSAYPIAKECLNSLYCLTK